MTRILLSSSQPHGDRAIGEAEPYWPADIDLAVSAVVGEVLKRPGWVLRFGGHPSITAQVLMISQELGSRRSGSIELVQSLFFEGSYTDEMRTLAAAEGVETTFTEAGGDQKSSLVGMRDVLLGVDADAAFFVGGMSGIIAEYERLRQLQPDTRAYAFTEPGGAAARLDHDHDDKRLTMIDGAAYDVRVRRLLDHDLGDERRR